MEARAEEGEASSVASVVVVVAGAARHDAAWCLSSLADARHALDTREAQSSPHLTTALFSMHHDSHHQQTPPLLCRTRVPSPLSSLSPHPRLRPRPSNDRGAPRPRWSSARSSAAPLAPPRASGCVARAGVARQAPWIAQAHDVDRVSGRLLSSPFGVPVNGCLPLPPARCRPRPRGASARRSLSSAAVVTRGRRRERDRH